MFLYKYVKGNLCLSTYTGKLSVFQYESSFYLYYGNLNNLSFYIRYLSFYTSYLSFYTSYLSFYEVNLYNQLSCTNYLSFHKGNLYNMSFYKGNLYNMSFYKGNLCLSSSYVSFSFLLRISFKVLFVFNAIDIK